VTLFGEVCGPRQDCVQPETISHPTVRLSQFCSFAADEKVSTAELRSVKGLGVQGVPASGDWARRVPSEVEGRRTRDLSVEGCKRSSRV
jgi:hypothetical protein